MSHKTFSLEIPVNPLNVPQPLKEPKRTKEPKRAKPSQDPKPSMGRHRHRKAKQHAEVNPVPAALMAGMAERLMEEALSS
jgi:hypothetical protein